MSTSIEWTDETWNPFRVRVRPDAAAIATQKGYTSLVQIATDMAGKSGHHCEHVSPECDNCYAERGNGRCLPSWGTGLPYDRRSRDLVEAYIDEETLMLPLKWKRPRRIFVGSQTDVFGDWYTDEMLDRLFAVMALCPQHTFQVLTKRSKRMRAYVTNDGNEDDEPMRDRMDEVAAKHFEACHANMDPPERWPLPNVWLGVSAGTQAAADERIPDLLATPAAKRFVSYEPALEAVDFRRYLNATTGITGNVCLQGGHKWRVDDRRPGSSLEEPNTEGQAVGPAPAETSREQCGPVPTGESDVAREEVLHRRPSASLLAFQGSDSIWPNDQPQERRKEGQSTREFRIGDGPRASTPCSSDSQGWPRLQPERGAQFDGEACRAPGLRDSRTAQNGRVPEVDCERLQRERQNGIEDYAKPTLDLVICGGESGPGARPFDLAWARDIIRQCRAAGVACFVKQLGAKPYGPCLRCGGKGSIITWEDGMPGGAECPESCYGDKRIPLKLKNKKGGDMAEWAEELRVREMPS